MSNPNGRKGASFEQAVCDHFKADGWENCERRVKRGKNDAGDVAGLPNVCLELKNTKELDLAGAMTEAKVEAGHAGARYYAAILKRRGKPTSDSYAVMTLDQFSQIMRIVEAHGYLR